jgi:hypothetical protein
VSWKALLALGCHATVVVLAWTLTRRRVEHRPFAVWATAMLVADLARWAIIYACPWITTPGPFEGGRRVIGHVDQVLFLSWSVGLAAAGWVVFLRRRPGVPLLAGALVQATLVLGGIRRPFVVSCWREPTQWSTAPRWRQPSLHS